MILIERLRDRIDRLRTRYRLRCKSVQYERQWMTHKGGWKNADFFYVDGHYDRPESDDDYVIGQSGRYREIRRVDGRIEEVIWTYETEDADEYYEWLREKERLDAIEEEERAREMQELTEEIDRLLENLSRCDADNHRSNDNSPASVWGQSGIDFSESS